MKAIKRYGQQVLAAVLTLSILLGAAAPIYAADYTGKTITGVSITGNTTIPESQISPVVKAKPGDKFDASKIQQDLKAIYELGTFFDVVAKFTEVPEGVKVNYALTENPVLKSVAIKGNTKVTTDKVMSFISTPVGQVLNSKSLNDNAKQIEAYYHDQGYVLARIVDFAMTPEGALTIVVNEGNLEGIVVKGNEKTKTNVITREMKLKVGDAFNAKDAKKSMQKVYNLGYFEDVNMKLNPGKEPNAVVLETDVVEQKTGTFSIGGGYSQVDGMVGIVEIGDNNFRGLGDKIKMSYQFGGKTQGIGGLNYQFSYTRPWMDKKQTSLSFDFYNMTTEWNDYGYPADSDYRGLRSTYDRRRAGWDITLGRPQGDTVQNFITFKSRKDIYEKYVSGPVNYGVGTQADPTAQAWYDAHPNWLRDNFGLTRSVVLERVYDTRDNVFNPTEGTRMAVTAEFAGHSFGGDFNFNKYSFEDRKYFKVGKDNVIALRVQAGIANGRMPEAGKFVIGGADTLRGYNDGQFTGSKMFTATAEYRFPVAKKVEGVLFTDTGNAWNSNSYKLAGLKSSVGVGIRVNTPLGPIRVDYAKGSEGGKTDFSFGGQF